MGSGWRGVFGSNKHGRFVLLYPSTLRDILKTSGHDEGPVLTRWYEDGVLLPATYRRTFEFRVAGGDKARGYAFRLDRLQPPEN